MMYNVARALALVGLVGVAATNGTNTSSASPIGGTTTGTSGSGCSAHWADASASGNYMSRRSLAANERQLASHNTTSSGSSNCPTDVPQCFFAFAEFSGLESSYVGNSSCPTSYAANDGNLFKDAVKRVLCGPTDKDGCYAAAVPAITLKLKCKHTTGGGTYPASAVAFSATRRLATAVTLHLTALVDLSSAKGTTFTAAKIGEALFALNALATTKTAVGTALKTGLNAATAVTGNSVASNHAAVSTITVVNAAITVSKTDCSGLVKLSAYKTDCGASTALKCTNFKAGAGPGGPASNAVSFILSSAVLAIAALI